MKPLHIMGAVVTITTALFAINIVVANTDIYFFTRRYKIRRVFYRRIYEI